MCKITERKKWIQKTLSDRSDTYHLASPRERERERRNRAIFSGILHELQIHGSGITAHVCFALVIHSIYSILNEFRLNDFLLCANVRAHSHQITTNLKSNKYVQFGSSAFSNRMWMKCGRAYCVTRQARCIELCERSQRIFAKTIITMKIYWEVAFCFTSFNLKIHACIL